jgi:ATP/ADP translocase
MLGRLVLVIHWGMFVWIAILLAVELITYGLERLFHEKGFSLLMLLFLIPFVLFALIYWIIKERWAFFPWQHVTPEE